MKSLILRLMVCLMPVLAFAAEPPINSVFKDAEGNTVILKADGSKTIKKADGTMVEVRADGSKTIQTPDGTKIEVKAR